MTTEVIAAKSANVDAVLRGSLGAPPLLTILLALGGCDSPDLCFEDESCPGLSRCEITDPSEPGECVPCDDEETPYDGIDNDCTLRTPDSDLDRDGQNASLAGGTDCDDLDPDVFAGAPDHCEDQIDGDCDGLGGPGSEDDPDCGDFERPTVRIVEPFEGERLYRRVTAVLSITDDAGVIRVDVDADGTAVATFPLNRWTEGRVELEVDLSALEDGPARLGFTVIDRAGQSDLDSVEVIVDNIGAPVAQLESPDPALGYDGTIGVVGRLEDPDGVASASLIWNGAETELELTEQASFTATISAEGLEEGGRPLVIRATDPLGNTRDNEVEVRVDRTGPVVTAEGLGSGPLSGVVPLVLTAQDPSGVARMAVLEEASSGARLSFDFDTTRLENGRHVLEVTAQDRTVVDGRTGEGNVSVTPIPIETSNPEQLRFLQPSTGTHVLGPTRFRIQPMMQGVDTIELFVGGIRRAVVQSPFEANLLLYEEAGPVTVVAVADSPQGSLRGQVTVQQVALPPTITGTSLPWTGRGTEFGVANSTWGDIDGDGTLDLFGCGLASSYVRDRTLLALPGVPTPGGVQLAFPTLGPPGGSCAGIPKLLDIDGDTRPEGVYARLPTGLSVVRFDGFRPVEVATSTATAQADLVEVADADGRPPLDIFAVYVDHVEVFTPRMTGTRRIATASFGQVTLVAFVGDVDGDGDGDVAAYTEAGDTVLLVNDGGGGFTRQVVQLGVEQILWSGDVDGDGHQDLLARDDGVSTQVELLLGRSDGGWDRQVLPDSAGLLHRIAVGDVDGDRRADILASDSISGVTAQWSRPAGGTQFELRRISNGYGGSYINLVDIDRDGLLDRVHGDGTQMELQINPGSGAFGGPSLIPMGSRGVAVGRFAGAPAALTATVQGLELYRLTQLDQIDLVWRENLTLRPEFLTRGGLDQPLLHQLQQGSTLSTVTLGPTGASLTPINGPNNPQSGVAADFDADGTTEYALDGSNQIQIVESNGRVVASFPQFRNYLYRAEQLAPNEPPSLMIGYDTGSERRARVVTWDGTRYVEAAIPLPNELSGNPTIGIYGFSAAPTGASPAIHALVRGRDAVFPYNGPGSLGMLMTESVVGFGDYSSSLRSDDGQMLVEDLNGDGLVDLFLDTVMLIRNPDGGWFPAVRHGVGTDGRVLDRFDLNGDGRTDIYQSRGPYLHLHVLP